MTKRTIEKQMQEWKDQEEIFHSAAELLSNERKKAARVGRGGSMFSVSAQLRDIYGVIRVTPELEGVYNSAGGSPFDSEMSIVEYALAFANADTDRSEYLQVLTTDDELRRYIAAGDPNLDLAVRADERLYARKRLELRDCLSIVLSDRLAAIESLMSSKEPLDVWYVAELYKTTSGVRMAPHAIFRNERAFLVYVATLLLNDSKPASKGPPPLELCKCKLCHRFFLLKRGGGRARRDYCCENHMKIFHASTSTERANKSRQKKLRKHK